MKPTYTPSWLPKPFIYRPTPKTLPVVRGMSRLAYLLIAGRVR